jgi:hypothetical protein
VTVVELGHAGPTPTDITDPHHRLYHLSDRGLVVVVQTRRGDRWRCAVIAATTDHAPRHVELTDTGLAAAATGIAVTGPQGFALVWQTRAHQRWQHPAMDRIAQALSVAIRPEGTVVVTLDDRTIHNLVRAGRLRPPGLPILLAWLRTAGMLSPHPFGTNPTSTHLLTLPELALRRPCGRGHGDHGAGRVA